VGWLLSFHRSPKRLSKGVLAKIQKDQINTNRLAGKKYYEEEQENKMQRENLRGKQEELDKPDRRG